MTAPRFKPSVTVAAIVERAGRFLLVEEHTPEGLMLNNPAGHLEQGESPTTAVARECLEETTCRFEPRALLGVYVSRFQRPARAGKAGHDVTYLRFAYTGLIGEPDAALRLDHGIVRTLWLTPDEMRALGARMRSPLVLRCMEDHLKGQRLPLAAISVDDSVFAPLLKHPLTRPMPNQAEPS